MKVCGCVTLYHPDDSVLNNILSYIGALDVLYVMDNSEEKNVSLVEKISKHPKCIYMDMKGNKGIAAVLNYALKRAKRNGYQWLLTMDQDSMFPKKNLEEMKNYIEKELKEPAAIVCARYRNYKDNRKSSLEKVSYVWDAVTSGSMVEVNIALKLGGFQEKLFIDEVDNEYCYRAILNGYKIIRLNNILFQHCLGNQKVVNGVRTFNYPPFRCYYLIRNNCYVIRKYKKYPILNDVCKKKKEDILTWMNRVWYEEEKYKKIAYMMLGYLHFLLSRMGKL